MYVNGGFEQGKIKFKPRLKLYHKIYIHSVILAFQSFNLIGSLPWAILHKGYYSFKIFLSFWLAQIPRLIVMQNQKCSKSCKGSIGLERRELSEWVIFHSRIYWMTQWLQWQVWQPLKCFFTDGPLHSLTGYLRHSPQVQMWKRSIEGSSSWLGLLHCKLNSWYKTWNKQVNKRLRINIYFKKIAQYFGLKDKLSSGANRKMKMKPKFR